MIIANEILFCILLQKKEFIKNFGRGEHSLSILLCTL